MKKWQSFLLMVFGISIPVVTYQAIFSFHLPGPIYFLAVTPIYVALTLYLAKNNKNKSAKKIIGILALAGLLIPFVFLALYLSTFRESSFDYQNRIEEVMITLYPSSIFYMALDTPGGNPETGAVIGVYASAITVNVLLYSLYGCIIYYFVKLLPKTKKVPANAET